MQNDWGSGFTAQVSITNTGTAAINGWTLSFTFPGNQTINPPGWSATWSQAGATVTASNLDWNRTIAPGSATPAFGFNATYTATNTRPATFTLNGNTCTTG